MTEQHTPTSPARPAGRATRVVAMMNQKGGVGKTTTTVNLAAAIARLGRPTLVVDLDPQAHATLHLGVDAEGEGDGLPSIYDLLEDPAGADAACRPVRDNLWLLPSETNLAGAEAEWLGRPGSQSRLKRVLDAVSGRFEFVFIDCPPSLGLLTVNALCAAREVFIPMQAHFLALQGVGKLLETVSALRGSAARPGLNAKLRVSGIILCMHDKQATHTQEVVNDLEAFFKKAREEPDAPWRYARIYGPPIRRNIKLAECPSFGQTIFDYAPTAAGAEDYLALADGIIREWDKLLERREAPAQVVVTPAAAAALAKPGAAVG